MAVGVGSSPRIRSSRQAFYHARHAQADRVDWPEITQGEASLARHVHVRLVRTIVCGISLSFVQSLQAQAFIQEIVYSQP